VESAISPSDEINVQGFDLSPEARAEADLKFTYVVTCQIYGKQKEEQKPEAADIALLMQRWVSEPYMWTSNHGSLDLLVRIGIIIPFFYGVLCSFMKSYCWLLACRNEALRVAFIDVMETTRVQTEYYSKLVKGDINGQDKVKLSSAF